MLRQLENSKYSQDSDEDERAALFRRLTVATGMLYDENNEERDDSKHVENIHDVPTERQLRRAGDESEHELNGEPRDAGRLYDEERVEVVGYHPIGVAIVCCGVYADVAADRRNRLHAEIDDRDDDTGNGDDGEYLCSPRTVWFLAQQPYPLLPSMVRKDVLLFRHETLLLLILADRALAQLVEFQLLEEDVFWNLDWPTQSSAALVEIKDRLKGSKELSFTVIDCSLT